MAVSDHPKLDSLRSSAETRAVRAIAETGVDIISVGALTHSAPSMNVGLDMVIDG